MRSGPTCTRSSTRCPTTATIVGWYHSHPGFGIFLSEHDRFIHRHFFGEPGQIALVIDPLAHVEGLFAWVGHELTMVYQGDVPFVAATSR